MAIVMNMSGYEIERDVVAAEEYGDEVLRSGWNPQLAEITERAERPSMPEGLANVDVDAFLKKMYEHQR